MGTSRLFNSHYPLHAVTNYPLWLGLKALSLIEFFSENYCSLQKYWEGRKYASKTAIFKLSYTSFTAVCESGKKV